MDKKYSKQMSRPAYTDLGAPEKIEPIFPEGMQENMKTWKSLRHGLIERWEKILGSPSFGDFKQEVELIETFEQPYYIASLYAQSTGPETKQRILIMEPRTSSPSPRPAAIVPYYHPDLMAGCNIKNRRPITERKNVQFGLHLVQQGYIAACTEAFPYGTVTDTSNKKFFNSEIKKFFEENPHWTGIGKRIWDTRLALDLLMDRSNLDKNRILAIGHSLGGKIAFCAGCLDERIKAVIGSDFGMGWSFTNWDADWHFGKQINGKNFTAGLHHLLALHAPNSFLLIGGMADRPESWQYINEAKKIYRLYGKEDAVGFFHHASGHQPTEESVATAYRWLAEQFVLPEQK
ncbi:MAG TPA: alpha/beta hydrolase family protein [bacterium]|nr:alpha/beta hydrolase family protein [bacterium]